MKVAVTGGCGYIGACLVEELLARGANVFVLDNLVHGQHEVAAAQEQAGVKVVFGDIRDGHARNLAIAGADAVVHLAAIVGDPACARQPELAQETNVEATRALIDEVSGRECRFIFASTCSNYGRMADPTTPIAEDGQLHPVSLYAEQKVEMERLILSHDGRFIPTCLRFATVYGVSRRMRFDLTVNEFTRELWADRDLEVFGERFWRPYIHVRDAAKAIVRALEAPRELVDHEVYNVGRSGENYRKLDIVEAIRSQISTGRVRFVHRDEDPRDYKVSFRKVETKLRFQTERDVPAGIAEIKDALDSAAFGDPFDPRYRNIS